MKWKIISVHATQWLTSCFDKFTFQLFLWERQRERERGKVGEEEKRRERIPDYHVECIFDHGLWF